MSDETQVIEDAQDYLIKCNSCGRVQRKSDPAQCQCRGSGSWSYEGPLPVEEVNAAEWHARMGGPGPAGSDDYPEPADEDPPMGVMIDGVPHTIHDYVQEGDQTDDDAAIDEILDAEEDEDAETAGEFYEKRATGFEWALEQIIATNQEALEQKAKVKEAQARLKEEKEQLEGIQDNLNRLIQEAAKLKSADTPDPVKYPLYDRPKEESNSAKDAINGLFSKPEAIPPLPPDTQDEFMRIKRRDTRLDAIGISGRVTTALAKAGYHTVADIGKLTEASAPLTSVKGVGEAAAGEIIDRLCDVGQQWVTEWQQTHPEANGVESE